MSKKDEAVKDEAIFRQVEDRMSRALAGEEIGGKPGPTYGEVVPPKTEMEHKAIADTVNLHRCFARVEAIEREIFNQRESADRLRKLHHTIMKWLAGRGQADIPESKQGFLEIPIGPGADGEPRVLKFRRVVTMGGGSYAEHIGTGTRVVYDPEWDVMLRIEKLLAPPEPKA